MSDADLTLALNKAAEVALKASSECFAKSGVLPSDETKAILNANRIFTVVFVQSILEGIGETERHFPGAPS